MSAQNIQAVRQLYDAFEKGDLHAFEQGVSESLLWKEADNSIYCAGNPYRGFAAVRDGVFEPSLRDFEGFHVDLEQLIDGGDYVIGCGHYRGRSRVTGKELASQFCHVMHVDPGGKLDRLQEYSDTLQGAEVTGKMQVLEPMRVMQPAI
ncbi:MAG TPA: nuclear transport factor 2 family protein [Sphingomicrobium sp.]|nr:nuclear transport factor 2 family protein [Sphingomicrobium sp.]